MKQALLPRMRAQLANSVSSDVVARELYRADVAREAKQKAEKDLGRVPASSADALAEASKE